MDFTYTIDAYNIRATYINHKISSIVVEDDYDDHSEPFEKFIGSNGCDMLYAMSQAKTYNELLSYINTVNITSNDETYHDHDDLTLIVDSNDIVTCIMNSNNPYLFISSTVSYVIHNDDSQLSFEVPNDIVTKTFKQIINKKLPIKHVINYLYDSDDVYEYILTNTERLVINMYEGNDLIYVKSKHHTKVPQCITLIEPEKWNYIKDLAKTHRDELRCVEHSYGNGGNVRMEAYDIQKCLIHVRSA